VLNTVVTGAPVTQVRDWIYLVDVLIRATDEERVSLSTLRNLQFALPSGRTVPLGQFATLEFEREPPLVWRRDGTPTLTVQADVAQNASSEAVVAALAPQVAKLEASLPRSYHIATGGTVEESARSQASVFAVVPLMLFIAVTVLMVQLHSFSRLFLVLSVVPMGLIGIVATLLVFQKPLGFVAILGILALLGMIARNAVILIDQIEAERAQGKAIWDAVIEGNLAFPPHHAHRHLDRARHDPDRADHILGADVIRHHGRAAGGNRADADLPAGAVRGGLSRAGADGRSKPHTEDVEPMSAGPGSGRRV
jgi:multidrug efflux pump subunit AcrB